MLAINLGRTGVTPLAPPPVFQWKRCRVATNAGRPGAKWRHPLGQGLPI